MFTKKRKNEYKPDRVSPPGRYLRDHIEWCGWSVLGIALQLDMTVDELEDFMRGKLRMTQELAERLVPIVGGTAGFWLNVERNYRSWGWRLRRIRNWVLNPIRDFLKGLRDRRERING